MPNTIATGKRSLFFMVEIRLNAPTAAKLKMKETTDHIHNDFLGLGVFSLLKSFSIGSWFIEFTSSRSFHSFDYYRFLQKLLIYNLIRYL